MKKCHYCAEEIQDDAIKCKHCGEFVMPTTPKVKWYFNVSTIVIAFFCVGPLVLPLIWFHPTLSRNKKIIITIFVVFISYWLITITVSSFKSIMEYYKIIFDTQL